MIQSVFDNSYQTKNWDINIAGSDANSVIAVNPQNGHLVLAVLSVKNNRWETLSADGETFYQRDLNCYSRPQDSTVTGKVFNPDPLTTTAKLFSDIYPNSSYYTNDQDSFLNAQQQLVSFKPNFDGSIFSLSSPYVELVNYSTDTPDVAPVTSTIPQFYYPRAQSGFQDVNAFYHISFYHNYIVSLGFDCSDSIVDIDTHAITDDNSFFSPSYSPRRIYYGVGGVPDAEDADVVVHEYCHSVSYNAAPGSNVGLERRSLDEAFCDYNAASYSKSINTFNDQWVYNWDGHNQFWPGRVVNDMADIYPGSITQDIYTNGQMWSTTLFFLNGDIGRGVTDSLIIQTHYSYAGNISMGYAAQLLIDADSLLFNGAHYCNIYNRLLQHGFISAVENGCTPLTGLQLANNNQFQFYQDGNSYRLINPSGLKMTIQLLSITGQIIGRPTETNEPIVNYRNSSLPAGIYLVNILSNDVPATFKWVNAAR